MPPAGLQRLQIALSGKEGVKPEVRAKAEYALARSRPTAKRTSWSFTSANSALGTASAKDVHLGPGMVIATLCIRRYASGGSEYRARTPGWPRYALRKGLSTWESAARGGARSAEKA